MVSLSVTTTRTDGVTLVTARLDNPGRSRRVRVEHRLDGPVWPPRTGGVPAEGWTDDGFECVLAAGSSRPLGYATPAAPTEEPLSVAEVEPVDAEDDGEGFEPRGAVPSVEATPAAVRRRLQSPRPPREAVPLPAVADGPATADDPDGEGTDAASGDADRPAETRAGTDVDRPADAAEFETTLAAVERRVEQADRLSATADLATAAEVVATVGGVEGLRELESQLATDATRLRRLGERALSLADRAASADLPVETVERFR